MPGIGEGYVIGGPSRLEQQIADMKFRRRLRRRERRAARRASVSPS